ncbi:acyltransferase family protein [Corynebacterium aurimucosum]
MAKSSTYRTDIDGLRGLAIALVVFFHVFVGKVSAGVDVFLLIGGVFFFGPQIRNALNPRGLTPVQVVIRMLRRLFPALVVTVTVTLALALIVFPPTRWGREGREALSSLAYVQNFALSAAGQDYAAIGQDVSTYQHLWSMSAQLQIYLGSLLVIFLCVGVYRLCGCREGKALVSGINMAPWGLGIATLASFLYAMYLHGVDQGTNYYSPLSRFWEIGLGGLLGLWLTQPGTHRMSGTAGAGHRKTDWSLVGLALILATGVVMDGAQQFPGPATLMPLAGAALIIVAGPSSRLGRLLTTAPFQFLGRISYSLYLWHWPLLVLVTYLLSGGESNRDGMGILAAVGTTRGLAAGAGVIALSVVLAWLTLSYVEVPTRQKTKPGERSWAPGRLVGVEKGATAGIAALTVSAIALAAWAQPPVVSDSTASISESDTIDYPGPDALLNGVEVPPRDPVPNALNPIESFYPASHADGCTALFEHEEPILTHQRNTEDIPCAYGDLESARTMYLFGNSHADHILTTLDIVGRDQGIRIVPLLKMGCFPGGEPKRSDGHDYPECAAWTEAALEYMEANPATEGTFLISTQPAPGTMGPEQTPEGLRTVVERLNSAGMRVWGLRDTPWPRTSAGPLDVRDCVAAGGYVAGDPLLDCGVERDDSLLAENPAVSALAGLDVTHLDLTNAMCGPERCPGVIGNVMVYRDSSHLTNTFAAMLSNGLERQMYGGTLPSDEFAEEPAAPSL